MCWDEVYAYSRYSMYSMQVCVITTQERECAVLICAGTWHICDSRSSGYIRSSDHACFCHIMFFDYYMVGKYTISDAAHILEDRGEFNNYTCCH